MGRHAKRLFAAAGLLAALAAPASAFVPAAVQRQHAPAFTNSAVCITAATVSGAPSAEARNIDPKEALSQSTVYRLDGSPISVSDLMSDEGVSLIVLTRSFGEELLANGVQFALISIGKPEIGVELCAHLGVEGESWIYADPENDAYDRLQLNRGWSTMARPATAFRFKDRIFGGKASLDQLFEVLGKWKDAVYIPPKLEQSTNHGGTFIFNGDDVVFAHYDESPGTHADTCEAVEMAIEAANKR
ncbi:hypothetical protein ACHAXT_009099 [Thalassiosira profunda]